MTPDKQDGLFYRDQMHQQNQDWLKRLDKGLSDVIKDVSSIKGQLKLIGFLLGVLELALHIAEHFKR